MPEKLKEIIARYSEIERLMSLPENYSDAGAYSRWHLFLYTLQ